MQRVAWTDIGKLTACIGTLLRPAVAYVARKRQMIVSMASMAPWSTRAHYCRAAGHLVEPAVAARRGLN